MIEDAAHATGTSYKGRHIGARGTAIFSFHAIKNITCAEGGIVVTDNPQFADKLRSLKFHGLGVDARSTERGRAPQAEVPRRATNIICPTSTPLSRLPSYRNWMRLTLDAPPSQRSTTGQWQTCLFSL